MGRWIKELSGQIFGSPEEWGAINDTCSVGGEARASIGSQYRVLATELRENIGSGDKWPGKGRGGPKGGQCHRHQTGEHVRKKGTVNDVV